MTLKSLFAPMPPRDPGEAHRQATPLEIFFDLISVIAIASVTAGLHHAISEGHGVEKLPVFFIIFMGIWWAWMNFTWFAASFDNDGVIYRVLVLVIMGGELLFASGASYMFESMDFGWGIFGWTVMRVAMALLWLRASLNSEYRATCIRYAIGILVAQSCWILYYFIAGPGSVMFYVLGALFYLVELAVPPIAERKGRTPFHRHHIMERYGLLTIISLGEILLAVGLAFETLYGSGFNGPAVLTGISALIIVFGMFWIYFCEHEHMPRAGFLSELIWGYGHIFLFASIALLAAGISSEIDLNTDHSHNSQAQVSVWLGLPLTIFLLTLWFIRDRHVALEFRRYSLPATAILSACLGLLGAPAWAFAVLMLGGAIWRVPSRLPMAGA
ncbi:low temperature requirement protein A [Hyphomonas sp. ND6WE1B]|uniref:low temperature requirement protein A n=1 Tax=Hyphomonas sp. ND6WE1B TaxID=1848191 RepID=UPI0008075DA7|nr:low temperature requirement protein A [Hyphomonas sp. ND6WE1B]